MTTDEHRNQVALLAATRPVAAPLPKGTPLDNAIDYARAHLLAATSLDHRMKYARELVRLRRARGDFAKVEQVVQLDDTAEDKLARIEAYRAFADLPGGRYD